MAGARGAVLLFALLALLQVVPAVSPLGNRGAFNWNSFCGQAQAEVTSLQRHGQLPLWNPWRGGGQVALAEPESMFFSPVTPLALLVGVMPAFKLLLAPVILAGCFGFWLLAGRLGLSGAARLLPALLVFGSTVPLQDIVNGLPNWLFGLALLPWLLLAFDHALDDHRHVFTAGLAWAAVLACGDIYHFVFDAFVIGLWALARGCERRSARPLLVALATGLAGVCFAAFKLLPLYDVYAAYPREVSSDLSRHVTPELLLRALVDPFLAAEQQGGSLIRRGSVSVDWYDTWACIGPPALLAAALALTRPRRALAPLLIAAIFAWLALGPSVRPDLWRAASGLPIVGSMRLPERLTSYVMVGVALLAGLGVERLRAAWRPVAVGLCALTCLAGTLLVGLPLMPCFPLLPVSEPEHVPPFRQECMAQPPTSRDWGPTELQPAVVFNQGAIQGQHDIPNPGRVLPASSPLYRGEVFLRAGHGRVEAELTPHVLHVRADLAAADVLLVNQNWFAGWVATDVRSEPPTAGIAGPLHEAQGLPALALPAGRHEVTLRFTQPGVRRGALLAAATLAVALAYAGRRGRVRTGFGRREAAALLALAGIAALAGLPQRQPEAGSVTRPPPREVVVPADADVQALLDAAAPGDRLLLPAGRWPGLVIRRGVSVAVIGGGRAVLDGPLVLEGLPFDERACLAGPLRAPSIEVRDCLGELLVQDVEAGPGGLLVSDSARPHGWQLDVRGPTRVERSVLRLFGGALRGTLDAQGAQLFLNGTCTEAAVLRDTRLVLDGDTCPAPMRLALLDGSRAQLSGPADPDAVEQDAGSTLVQLRPALPRVARMTVGTEGLVRVLVAGPPGASGVALVGYGSAREQQPGDTDNWLLLDLWTWNTAQPFTLPQSGVLMLEVPYPRERIRPGDGLLAQVASVRRGGPGFTSFTSSGGVLIRPDAGRSPPAAAPAPADPPHPR